MGLFKKKDPELLVSKAEEKRQKWQKFVDQQIKFTVLSIVAVLIIALSSSYAIFSSVQNGTKYNVIKSGTLSVTYNDTDTGLGNVISLNGAYPTSDTDGQATTPYIFKVTNNGTLNANYTISIVDDTDMITTDGCSAKQLDKNFVKFSINGGTPVILGSLSSSSYVIKTGILNAGASKTYSVRVWLSDTADATALGKHFHGKIEVNSVNTANNSEGEPNAPELIGDMIPVVYDNANSVWVKASTTNGTWYDYDTQNWANAVTISDTTKRAAYKSAAVGTAVLMDDINAMFVWIPRYSYTIGNTYGVQGYGGSTPSQATPGAIDIKFVSTSTTDTGTATYTGSTASNYYTSPAFCWGDTCDSSRTDATNVEKSGIWVAKFETTAGASSTCTTSSSTANCNLSTIVPVIKPNIASWRYVQVANMFTAIQTNMNSTNGTTNYGFSGSTYGTHMMKNIEWGAVAYLSQSKYGKYGNTTYSGANKEIYQNKSSSYITGMSNGTPSNSTTNTQVTYNTADTGVGASTTGNISGIYDMSGGAYEYVMGNMMTSENTAPEVGYSTTYTSGFTGKVYDSGNFTSVTGITFPSNKYYNKYTYGTSDTDYARGILGDATKEMSPASDTTWYLDNVGFVGTDYPWFLRGGYYSASTHAGVFDFFNGGGDAVSDYSFRVVTDP